jgi:hypothetical protein
VRVVMANGAIFDFVICFECHQVCVYRGDKKIAKVGITGSQKRLDDILTGAGIPLARKQ